MRGRLNDTTAKVLRRSDIGERRDHATVFMAMFGILLLAPAARAEDDAAQSPSAMLDEVWRSFTIDGKPIPPQIFLDMGDGDMADSESIRVTIDVKAAIGSNLYYDEVKPDGPGWVAQRKIDKQAMNGYEETAYHYVGSTTNNLLVVIASYNGGGSGTFTTLHILDLAGAKAFDSDGHVYDRIDLSTLRNIPLGDRWNGTAKIFGNDAPGRSRPACHEMDEAIRHCHPRDRRAKKHQRKYAPDFLVEYEDSRKAIIEVKDPSRMDSPDVLRKRKAAEIWCNQRRMEYVIPTIG
jgi:hypothetical protein